MLLLGALIGTLIYYLAVRRAAVLVKEAAHQAIAPPPPAPPTPRDAFAPRAAAATRLTLARRLTAWTPVSSPTGNPLYWRHGTLIGVRAWIALLAAAGLTAGMVVRLLPSGNVRPSSDGYELTVETILPVCLLCLALPICQLFPRERQGGTLEVLLSTRLSWRDLVWGHLRGPLRDLLLLSAVTLLLLYLMCPRTGPSGVLVWGPAVSVLLYGWVALLLSFRCALTAASIMRAMAWYLALATAMMALGHALALAYSEPANRHLIGALSPYLHTEMWSPRSYGVAWPLGADQRKPAGWWTCLWLHWGLVATLGGLLWLELRLRCDRLLGRQGEG